MVQPKLLVPFQTTIHLRPDPRSCVLQLPSKYNYNIINYFLNYNVTGPGKTGHICTFCVSRNTNLKY